MSLETALDRTQTYGLAFSGGCDSSYLLALLLAEAYDVKAYMVKTAFQADFELEDARHLVQELNAPFELIEANIFDHAEICANPWDRCYYCKKFIFTTILDAMARDGRTILLDGTNASDNPLRRPGFRALQELNVRSPLRELNLTKDDIRDASRKLKLFTASKPNFSCLATHIETGEIITPAKLQAVAQSLNLAY